MHNLSFWPRAAVITAVWYFMWSPALAAPVVPNSSPVSFGPGQFSVSASNEPFLHINNTYWAASGVDFYLRADNGVTYAYDGSDPRLSRGILRSSAGYYQGPGSCAAPTTCQLVFQIDGNLVFFLNGTPVWESGTSGTGAILTFSPGGLFMTIYDASGQKLLYYSNLPPTPSNPGDGLSANGPAPGTGSPSGGCPGGCGKM